MAVGESGKAIETTNPVQGAGPEPAAAKVGKHVHKIVGPGERTVGGPGVSSQHPGNTARSGGLK